MNVDSLKIEASWKELLKSEFESEYFDQLLKFVTDEYTKHTVYPPENLIFNAFNLLPLEKVRVVILGQDPYHKSGQAHGLCFSVQHGIAPPPSLVNIYKEIKSDLGIAPPKHGNLEAWVKQGVFLLNATLTVREHNPRSHAQKGWERFTNAVIKHLSENREGIVFLLWGNDARNKEKLIDTTRHFVLKAPHPSPLSAYSGFFGCNHFSITNQLLQKQGFLPINWTL